MLDSVRNNLWSRPMDALLAMSFPGWRAVAARWLRHAQARTERKLARERRSMVSADEEWRIPCHFPDRETEVRRR